MPRHLPPILGANSALLCEMIWKAGKHRS